MTHIMNIRFRPRHRPGSAGLAIALVALNGCGGDDEPMKDDLTAQEVRSLIDRAVPGGLASLTVPATDAEIPVPPAPDGYAGRFDTTEAKRYLGKLLFHDPIRTQRVNVNAGQPLDFPAATAFGGTIGVTDSPEGAPPGGTYATSTSAAVEAVRMQTAGTGSCGSCHIG